jgi:hypothetical protein
MVTEYIGDQIYTIFIATKKYRKLLQIGQFK